MCVWVGGERTIDMPMALKLQARPPQDHTPALQSNVCVCGGGGRTIDMPIFSEGSDMPTDDPSHALTMGLHLAPFRGNGVQGVPLQCTIVYLYTVYMTTLCGNLNKNLRVLNIESLGINRPQYHA